VKYDEIRTAYLNGVGITVIRFENEEVFQSPEGVMAEIKKFLTTAVQLIAEHPLLLKEGSCCFPQHLPLGREGASAAKAEGLKYPIEVFD